MKKRGLALLMAVVMMMSVGLAAAEGWQSSSGRWWYSYADGSFAQNTWMNDGSLYYFDGAGWMVTGWQQIGGTWYYFAPSGAMATGWLQIGGTWYYVAPSGAMVTGWQEIGSTWYYFTSGGAMATGWQKIGGDWYYFDPSGAMHTGWLQLAEGWYWFGSSGAMRTGIVNIDGTKYKFDTNGLWIADYIPTGWVNKDGGYSYILDDGTPAKGWQSIQGNWYYFDENAIMVTGWLQTPDAWYFFNGNGAMVTGSIVINGVMYIFDDSGRYVSEHAMGDIDFQGKTVYIYDYWSGSKDWHNDDPESDLYKYRKSLEEKYNCKIIQTQLGDWGSCAYQMADYVEDGGNGDDSLALFIIEPGKVFELVRDGMAAPWSYDFSGEKWNKASLDYAPAGGKIYAVSTGKSEPRGLLYFNKRVLEEAGIDWNTIYDAQKNGTWTWAMFENMLKTVTRDTDNDGVNDIYGLIGSLDDFSTLATFSNGGAFFDYDANGKLQPVMGSDATVNALNWSKDVFTRYWAPTPEGANWDWYKDDWKKGHAGFYMYQAYGGFNDNSEMADMEDEWGAVAFPTSGEGENCLTVASDNMTLIPALYDAETNAALATIYDEWTNPVPGHENDDSWIGNKYNYTDKRAVDETYAMLREPEHEVVNKVYLLGTANDVLGTSLLWQLGNSTPAELIKAGMSAWQALCDNFNETMASLFR